MKKRVFFFGLIIALLIYACEESSTDPNPGDDNNNDDTDELVLNQKPLLDFINQDSIVPGDNPTFINSTPYEFGTRMKFMRNGTIDGIGVQMPDSAMYRLTIWNLADTTVVYTDSILVDSGEVKYKTISPIQVMADDEIRITVQSNDWYWFNHISGQDNADIFPDTINDIILIDYAFIDGTAQAYPNSVNFDYYAGHADIVFNPTE